MSTIRPAGVFLLAGLVVSTASCHSPPAGGAANAIADRQAVAAQTEECGKASQTSASVPEPLWVDHGKLTRRGAELLWELSTVRQDGLDPANYLPAGPPTQQALSNALVRLARDLRRPPPLHLHYIDASLKPDPPCPAAVMEAASKVPLKAYLQELREPNGAAVALRRALRAAAEPQQRADIAADLALARSIGPLDRGLLVDTRSALLWELAGPDIVGRMRVVVGREGNETPPMAALIRWADVNPYWYVPPDLVRKDIAPRVIAQGPGYLEQHHYEAVDSYDDDTAHVLNPASVNWRAVESGASDTGLRQLPGPANMMGRVEFVLPNEFGVYLHDTPGRWVFAATDRHISHGCVRLEDAAQLFRFLFGTDLPPPDPTDADDEYDPDRPVPLFIAPLSEAGAEALSGSAAAPQSKPRILSRS